MRLLRWIVVCRCGRRCARLVAEPASPIVRFSYDCGGCGTHYKGDGTGKRWRA